MTHIDNIIALGNKIVDNLNTMGVSASFNDGALTLADKILDIETADYSNILLLYADKKIISKDETLELYSLYLEDGLPVSNETITFTVKDKNDTTVETLTGTTNTDGIANVSYLGKGTGDINIQASTNNSIILSETYSIEDCILYDTLISNKGYWVSTGGTHTFSENGLQISNSSSGEYPFKLDKNLEGNLQIELDIVLNTNNSGYAYGFFFNYGETNSQKLIKNRNSHWWGIGSYVTGIKDNGHITLKLNKNNNTISAYNDETIIFEDRSVTGSFADIIHFALLTDNDNAYTVKNLKIKSL